MQDARYRVIQEMVVVNCRWWGWRKRWDVSWWRDYPNWKQPTRLTQSYNALDLRRIWWGDIYYSNGMHDQERFISKTDQLQQRWRSHTRILTFIGALIKESWTYQQSNDWNDSPNSFLMKSMLWVIVLEIPVTSLQTFVLHDGILDGIILEED